MSTNLERLLAVAQKPERIVVGLMSGTSVDSIDVAICQIGPNGCPVKLIQYGERPYSRDLKARLVRVDQLDVRAIAELHVLVAEAFAKAAREVLAESPISICQVDLIGSHGQTVYHHSTVPGALRATLQLGDGDVIAERLGVPVVSDFRARDIAAGGEGAPLTPRADLVLYGASTEKGRRAVLNLGGIGNLTVLDADPRLILGFDTGPANALIDRAARRFTQGQSNCDQDGRFAAAGRLNETLLNDLVTNDEFLKRKPPKSTGFEMYGDRFLDAVIERHGGIDEALITTLTEFSAQAVAIALNEHIKIEPDVDEIIVAGGGANNPFLMQRIAALVAPRRLRRSEECGIPSEAREAMAFAIFADLTLRGQTSSLPSVTGAVREVFLGKLSF